jgi:predicted PurR-regulated permease PerM
MLAVIAFVAVTYLLFRIPHFWLIMLVALVLVTAIDGPVTWLRQHGVPRPLGVLVIYALLIGLMLVALLALVPVVVADARALERELPGYADQIESAVARFLPAGAGGLSLTELEQTLRSNASGLALQLTEIGVEVGRTAIYIFVTLVVTFFFAVDPAIILRQLKRFVPSPHRPHVARVATNIHERIGAWARGQLLIAIIFGAAMGAGLRLLGVPYAWSLGVVAGILEVVPYVGGAITVVLAGFSAATVGLPLVIGVVILYVVLVSIESHILAPVLYGRALGLPPVAILLALLAGVELLGILGALLAIPLTIIAWAIAEELAPDPQ